MAKKKPFDELRLSYQRRYRNLGFTKKPNTGLDTETYKGYVKLIASDNGDYKLIDSLLEILQFMTRKQFRNKFNWFFNIKYDFESIVKYLDRDLLYELYYEKQIQYGRYFLKYYDKKFIGITDPSKNHYYFYDLFNFLETSLNSASKKYLQDSKLDIVDAEKLNKDWNYWLKNYDDIIKYCVYDANLTKRLADYFWDKIYTHLEFYPKRPFSKGKLSEEYFLSKCYIPTINDIPREVLKYAYNSYSGGRFELLKKGFFKKVYLYDIKSAYPYQMTKLMDFSLGHWNKTREVSENIGFYHCYCSAMEINFSPFLLKRGGLNVYPNGSFYQYLTSEEIKFIQKNFKNCEINIISGFEFIPYEEKYPFKEEILRLYKWKEAETDEDIKYCVKIILNSLYGKTIQGASIGYTGKLFNPIWASLITSGTRIDLLKKALEKPDNIISLSTDSISSKEELKYSDKPELGDFAIEFEGRGIYIMSDVYTLWNPEKYKKRFRSFTIAKDTIPTLFDMLNIKTENDKMGLLDILLELKHGTKYPIKIKSPYHLGECLIHTKIKNPEMINIFHTSTKNFNINGDIRRIWDRDFKNGTDALYHNINSYPVKFDVKER